MDIGQPRAEIVHWALEQGLVASALQSSLGVHGVLVTGPPRIRKCADTQVHKIKWHSIPIQPTHTLPCNLYRL